jgi:hypothetical protein
VASFASVQPSVCLPLYFFYLGAFPVPDSGTDCGEPVTLSLISRFALCGVVSGGVKVTDTLQLLPGMSDVSAHSDDTANADGDGDTLSPSMLTARPVFLLPAFLIVTVLGLLVFPTVTLFPNASEAGLIVSFSEIGVGVAVAV